MIVFVGIYTFDCILTSFPIEQWPSIMVLVPISTLSPIIVFSLMVTPWPVLKLLPISTSLYIIEFERIKWIFT